MDSKTILSIAFKVLKDINVIITVVCMLAVIAFTKYVVNYTKKAPKIKVAKKQAAPEAPQETEQTQEEAETSQEE